MVEELVQSVLPAGAHDMDEALMSQTNPSYLSSGVSTRPREAFWAGQQNAARDFPQSPSIRPPRFRTSLPLEGIRGARIGDAAGGRTDGDLRENARIDSGPDIIAKFLLQQTRGRPRDNLHKSLAGTDKRVPARSALGESGSAHMEKDVAKVPSGRGHSMKFVQDRRSSPPSTALNRSGSTALNKTSLPFVPSITPSRAIRTTTCKYCRMEMGSDELPTHVRGQCEELISCARSNVRRISNTVCSKMRGIKSGEIAGDGKKYHACERCMRKFKTLQGLRIHLSACRRKASNTLDQSIADRSVTRAHQSMTMRQVPRQGRTYNVDTSLENFLLNERDFSIPRSITTGLFAGDHSGSQQGSARSLPWHESTSTDVFMNDLDSIILGHAGGTSFLLPGHALDTDVDTLEENADPISLYSVPGTTNPPSALEIDPSDERNPLLGVEKSAYLQTGSIELVELNKVRDKHGLASSLDDGVCNVTSSGLKRIDCIHLHEINNHSFRGSDEMDMRACGTHKSEDHGRSCSCTHCLRTFNRFSAQQEYKTSCEYLATKCELHPSAKFDARDLDVSSHFINSRNVAEIPHRSTFSTPLACNAELVCVLCKMSGFENLNLLMAHTIDCSRIASATCAEVAARELSTAGKVQVLSNAPNDLTVSQNVLVGNGGLKRDRSRSPGPSSTETLGLELRASRPVSSDKTCVSSDSTQQIIASSEEEDDMISDENESELSGALHNEGKKRRTSAPFVSQTKAAFYSYYGVGQDMDQKLRKVWGAFLPAELGGEAVGEFFSPELAARAYDTKLRSLGDAAYLFPLNFPERPIYQGVEELSTCDGMSIFQAVVRRNGFCWVGSYASPEEAALAFDLKLEFISKQQGECKKSKLLFNFPARLVAASIERISKNKDARYSGYTDRTDIAEVDGLDLV